MKVLLTVLALCIFGSGCKRNASLPEVRQTYNIKLSGAKASDVFISANVKGNPKLRQYLPSNGWKGETTVVLVPVGAKETTVNLHMKLNAQRLRSAVPLELAEFIKQNPKLAGSVVTLYKVKVRKDAEVYLFLSPSITGRELRGKAAAEADRDGWNQDGKDNVYLLAVK